MKEVLLAAAPALPCSELKPLYAPDSSPTSSRADRLRQRRITAAALIFLPAALLVLTTNLNAQPWSSIIAKSRAVDWSTAGIAGGIPNRTTICATLNPGATAAQINSAI